MARGMVTMLALAAALPLAATGSGAAAAEATATVASAREYRVEVVMREGDRTIGRPTLTVLAGEPATVIIGNESYLLKLVATAGDDARVALRSETALWTARGLAHDGASHDIAADGAPASFAFTRTDPKSGEESRVDVEVRVRPID